MRRKMRRSLLPALVVVGLLLLGVYVGAQPPPENHHMVVQLKIGQSDPDKLRDKLTSLLASRERKRWNLGLLLAGDPKAYADQPALLRWDPFTWRFFIYGPNDVAQQIRRLPGVASVLQDGSVPPEEEVATRDAP